jgi:hypothetical protein
MLFKTTWQLAMLTASLILLAACNGDNTTSTQAPNISIPLSVYKNSGGGTKYIAYTSVGGGEPVMTVVDTGSEVYFVNESAIGPNVTMTDQTVTLYYDFGHQTITGKLAYAPVSFYANNNAVITSSANTPIVVVPSTALPIKALMGVGMRGNLSPILYLPYPYNQALSVNLPESTLSFGVFNDINAANSAWVQLPSITCNTFPHGGNPYGSVNTSCWNTFAVPIKPAFNILESSYTAPVINGVLDTGSDSGIQMPSQPDYITLRHGNITNFGFATLNSSKGPLLMEMTPNKIYFAATTFNDPNGLINVGNYVFNFYQIIFDRYDGKVWFTPSPVNTSSSN